MFQNKALITLSSVQYTSSDNMNFENTLDEIFLKIQLFKIRDIKKFQDSWCNNWKLLVRSGNKALNILSDVHYSNKDYKKSCLYHKWNATKNDYLKIIFQSITIKQTKLIVSWCHNWKLPARSGNKALIILSDV